MPKVINEIVEDAIDMTNEYLISLQSMAIYDDNEHILKRKVETQIQNCIYFKNGLKEHFVKEVK